MSMLFHGAQAVFDASNTAFKPLGVEETTYQGKSSLSPLRHWPIAVAGISCLITAVSAIAMAILGNSAMALMQGAAAATSAIAAIYLYYIGPNHDLASLNVALTDRLTRLTAISSRLLETKHFWETNIPKLEARVQEKQDHLDLREIELRQTKKELTTVSGRFQDAASKLTTYAGDCQSSKRIIEALSTELAQLRNDIGALAAARGKISAQKDRIAEMQATAQKCQQRIASQQLQIELHIKQTKQLGQRFDETDRQLRTHGSREEDHIERLEDISEQFQQTVEAVGETHRAIAASLAASSPASSSSDDDDALASDIEDQTGRLHRDLSVGNLEALLKGNS